MLKNSLYLLISLVVISCSSDEVANGDNGASQTLAEMIAEGPVALEGVIACASGSVIDDEVIVYLYPRPGVTNIRYFETPSITVDPTAYENYTEVAVSLEEYFNGYLSFIKQLSPEEKWVIVTFEEEDVLQVSNPIRLKHKTQNTLFRTNVHANTSSDMPLFSWGNIANPNDVIYFQVVSDVNNNLLSGTYTQDAMFQYYKTNNVVLNITRDVPPNLETGSSYEFTMLGVSEDNWVNVLANRPFTIE